MKVYAKTATIPGGGKGFVFTGAKDGTGGMFPGAFEVDLPASLGQLAHGFSRSDIRPDATNDDVQLPFGAPILLPVAAAVERLAFLTPRTDGDFQQRSAGSDEGVSAISLEAVPAAGAALALPFAQTLRDPKRATITTSDPLAPAALGLCPEMTIDLAVKKGVSVAIFGFIQALLPRGSGVEVALFLKQAGAATFSEVAEYVRRRSSNGALNLDALDVAIPLGDIVPGAAVTATGVATLQIHWRAVLGAPQAVGIFRSFGASSIG